MTKRISVTRAQKVAAQVKIQRSAKSGRFVSPAVKAIAGAGGRGRDHSASIGEGDGAPSKSASHRAGLS